MGRKQTCAIVAVVAFVVMPQYLDSWCIAQDQGKHDDPVSVDVQPFKLPALSGANGGLVCWLVGGGDRFRL